MSERDTTAPVRCFARERTDGKRRGVWLMTRREGYRGAFFHGERCEIQPPRWTVEELAAMHTEITPAEALAEMDNGWPEAKDAMRKIFERHNTPYDPHPTNSQSM